jgi:hypothetical protein
MTKAGPFSEADLERSPEGGYVATGAMKELSIFDPLSTTGSVRIGSRRPTVTHRGHTYQNADKYSNTSRHNMGFKQTTTLLNPRRGTIIRERGMGYNKQMAFHH